MEAFNDILSNLYFTVMSKSFFILNRFSCIDLDLLCIKRMTNYPNGLDSTSVTNILKNTTTLLNFRNMFRCFKHHLQPLRV